MPRNNESPSETIFEQERRLSSIDHAGSDINPRKEEDESDHEDVNYECGDTDESKGVRSVQEAINLQHPFGIKLWKPALYKKDRSILAQSNEALHSQPGTFSNRTLYWSVGNIAWIVFFGWWMSLLYLWLAIGILGPLIVLGHLLKPCGNTGRNSLSTILTNLSEYSSAMLQVSHYIRWPFGKFISKNLFATDEFHLDSNEQHLRPYNKSNDDENEPLLSTLDSPPMSYYSTMIFKICLTFSLAPIHMIVSGICFFSVIAIPMGKLNFVLLKHLYLHALSLKVNLPTTPKLANTLDSVLNGNYTSKHNNYPSTSIIIDASLKTNKPEGIQHTTLVDLLYNSDVIDNVHNLEPPPEIEHIVHIPEIIQKREKSRLQAQNLERRESVLSSSHRDQIVLCIHHAIGFQYYKYTVDGVNIIFINLLAANIFCFVNYYILAPRNGFVGISSPQVIFASALLSVIPLAYFIGMSVSSITAQTGSLALGAVINATFGSIIEVLLYGFALSEGKIRLVEGSIIGSFLCGLLALPGASMLSDGLGRKESKFNAKSAGITSTLLIVALIGVFAPTIFQKIYGTFNLHCKQISKRVIPVFESIDEKGFGSELIGRQCAFVRPPPTDDPIYISSTKYLMYICTGVLLLTYFIGLMFTLMTHSKKIYPTPNIKTPKKKLNQDGSRLSTADSCNSLCAASTSIITAEKTRKRSDVGKLGLRHNVTSTFGAGIYLQSPLFTTLKKDTDSVITEFKKLSQKISPESDKSKIVENGFDSEDSKAVDVVGHDAPNWGPIKATFTLIVCTILFSMVAEILVTTVDTLLKGNNFLDEKFLGVTLFAIVPSFTEFYNAVAFGFNGNIALSLEIASAYTIQVALLQIPTLVIFSALYYGDSESFKPFILIFPQWDFYAVMMSTFLLTYIYIEGKSNYFKGSMLLLVYFILVSTFVFLPSSEV